MSATFKNSSDGSELADGRRVVVSCRRRRRRRLLCPWRGNWINIWVKVNISIRTGEPGGGGGGESKAGERVREARVGSAKFGGKKDPLVDHHCSFGI